MFLTKVYYSTRSDSSKVRNECNNVSSALPHGSCGLICRLSLTFWTGEGQHVSYSTEAPGRDDYQITCSFIEENHGHKLESKRQQYAQPMRPGAPSQDLMSFWGMLHAFSKIMG